jgi:hypothetical protein
MQFTTNLCTKHTHIPGKLICAINMAFSEGHASLTNYYARSNTAPIITTCFAHLLLHRGMSLITMISLAVKLNKCDATLLYLHLSTSGHRVIHTNWHCFAYKSSEVIELRRGTLKYLVELGVREYKERRGQCAEEYIYNKTNSMVWVRERTISTERPPLVGEVIANLCG